ncbi:macrophage mannose receptor 1-like isoform X2 [Trematomus bernacchii]|uniref:macrophage mannose receptor 1-like isoform X2 n=1 Tax=Trematomus bernacchii TaxID=40690 RepID=UPI00146A234F|nr:macrophage mannose receptor 1-like isoform X2 [Trematomus bernacchii]
MQWIQFVLILMGQCSFFTCDLYEYHFIQEGKTWDEAQSYCREHFTDLATVSDMRDVERLTNSSQTTDAWIGLRSINEGDIKVWHWSLSGEKYNPTECDPECGPEWLTNEPNNAGVDPQNCVFITHSKKWSDVFCSFKLKFICYNETGQLKYFLIDEPKNWLQAQSYCRENHTDLVSGITHIRSDGFTERVDEFKERVKELNNEDINKFLWIGLFREIWSWSDGKNFSFRHWDPDSFKDEASKTCAMTKPNGKWSSDICTDQKPFYCYDDKVILINESKTWDEALTYCRANHRVLVSITDRHQQRWVQERAKMADTAFVWLGMRYSCTLDLSFRVSDPSVCNPNLTPKKKTVRCDSAVAMKRDGKWYKKADSEKFHFICAK